MTRVNINGETSERQQTRTIRDGTESLRDYYATHDGGKGPVEIEFHDSGGPDGRTRVDMRKFDEWRQNWKSRGEVAEKKKGEKGTAKGKGMAKAKGKGKKAGEGGTKKSSKRAASRKGGNRAPVRIRMRR